MVPTADIQHQSVGRSALLAPRNIGARYTVSFVQSHGDPNAPLLQRSETLLEVTDARQPFECFGYKDLPSLIARRHPGGGTFEAQFAP